MLELTLKGKDFQELKGELGNLYDSIFKEDTKDVNGTFPTGDVSTITATETNEKTFKEAFQPLMDTAVKLVSDTSTPVDDKALSPTKSHERNMHVVNPPGVGTGSLTEQDANGLNWDKRIHSMSRNKNKDGSWRNRRGIEKELIKSVEAELKGSTSETVMEPEATIVQGPSLTIAPPLILPKTHIDNNVGLGGLVAPLSPFIASAPPTALVASPPTIDTNEPIPDFKEEPKKVYSDLPSPSLPKHVHTFDSFKNSLVPTIASLINDKKITQEYIGQLNSYFGVKELWELFSDDVKLQELFENFCEAGLVKKVD